MKTNWIQFKDKKGYKVVEKHTDEDKFMWTDIKNSDLLYFNKMVHHFSDPEKNKNGLWNADAKQKHLESIRKVVKLDKL